METTSLRTFIGSVVCIDLVGYSKLSVDRQIATKQRFNERLTKALGRVSPKDRIMLDTGDGVLIGFLGDPEECFAVTLRIRDAMDAGSVRIGIHLGPVKVIPGLSGEPRLVGDAANTAERIASLAEPGQIAVSRAFHSMVSRLSEQHEALFRNEETLTDKQGQPHEIYVVDAVRKAGVSKPLVAAIVGVAVVAIGVSTWLFLRRPAASAPAAPVVAAKIEAPPPAVETRRPASPPVEPAREAPMPTEVRTLPPAPVERKREAQPAPRSEPPPSESRRSAPPREERRPPPPAAQPSETRRFFSSLGGGVRDAAKTVGSTAHSVFSTVKEKTTGSSTPSSPPPSPPPTVVSRAATYYPAEASSQGINHGKVRARLDIDASGSVTRVTLLSSEPPEIFDREATRALHLWRFNPGADGRTYTAEIDFKR